MKTSLFLLLASTASAFTVYRPTFVQQPTALKGLMTDAEVESIVSKAHICAEGECSVEDVDLFLAELKDQQKLLRDRLTEVTNMISELTTANSLDKSDVREVDELKETVRAIARLFMMGDRASGNDYPNMGPPIGYSGDVGKGPSTAYDVLSPKKP